MDNEKLSLMDLKVKSFITAISKSDSWTVRAGSDITCHPTNCVNGGTITTSATGNGTGTGNTNTGTNTTGGNGNTTGGNTGGEDNTEGGPVTEGGG